MKRVCWMLAMLAGLLAVAGGAWGQVEGLAASERMVMSDTFQYALENNRTNQAAEWANPDAGRSGTVVPVRTYSDAAGRPCREFVTTVTIGGRQERAFGTACRQPDGVWRIVAGQAAPGVSVAPARPTYVYPYGYPYPARYPYAYYPGYYPYYYPGWFAFPLDLYLSFGYVHHGGSHHHGIRRGDGRRHPGSGRRPTPGPPRRHDGRRPARGR